MRATLSVAVVVLPFFVAAIPMRSVMGVESDPVSARYKLEVGQQLTYEGESTFEFEGGAFKSKHLWKFVALEANSDGSMRVLGRSETSRSDSRFEDQSATKDVQFGYFDLHPKGEVVEQLGSFGYRFAPNSVLPTLPEGARELEDGWQASANVFGSVVKYNRRATMESSTLVIEAARHSPEDEIYGIESQSTITFDLERGLVAAIETRTKQTYGFNGTGSGRTELVDSKILDSEAVSQLASDAERYFRLQHESRRATGDKRATAESLDAAVAMAKEKRDTLESEEFRAQVDQLIADFEKGRDYLLEEIQRRKSLVGQPAVEFEAPDLDGQQHALKDYRGKVVMLDFWYRGCGWCVRAMPQLKQVVDHYQGQDVVMLGMNTDSDVEDAKFVVEKLGLNYTNLRAEGLPEKFGVRGFPTLILIDAEGKIHDVHVGWSPTLKEDLIAQIDELLEPKE